MKSSLVILLISLYSYSANGQTCDLTRQTQYTSMLPNAITCGTALLQAQTTPDTDAGMDALDDACTYDCAGNISRWLASPECNNNVESLGLKLWCLPVDNAENFTRCRYAIEPEADPTLLNSTDLDTCTAFSIASKANRVPCPATCTSALYRIRSEMGCCYQSIYNSTQITPMVIANAGLDGNVTAYFLDLLGNNLLWQACGVTPPTGPCGDPFPMQPTTEPTTDGAQRIGQSFMLAAASVAIGIWAMIN